MLHGLQESKGTMGCAECAPSESPAFLTQQVITYLGNKRALLAPILSAVDTVKRRLGCDRLRSLDLFSGSGIVSRALKAHSSVLYANDLEFYASVINECYLANATTKLLAQLSALHRELMQRIDSGLDAGFITHLYAPQDDDSIRPGERVFYTRRNAMYIDTTRRLIDELVPRELRAFFIAPLLYEASVHVNTSGVFKGFYKNHAGVGQFGGEGRNALARIMADVRLPLPIFSRYETDCHVCRSDARELLERLPDLDFAYLDPPYNQHPYGSNYFMLNLIASNEAPRDLSPVSGIPADWNRSAYNKETSATEELFGTIEQCRASFLLLSYNSEGFVRRGEMERFLASLGKVSCVEIPYNTYRASRNLRNRALRVREFFFLLERK